MTWAIRGLIEGFYGRPWTWGERTEVARWCAERGMDHYVYAPKDDPLHRHRWREPYPADELDAFARLRADGGLAVGFGLSPGLSIDYTSIEDREALWDKVASVLGVGVSLIVLALDDIPNRPGLGDHHAALTTWLWDRLAGRAGLVLVPTEYVGCRPSAYLDALAPLPGEVAVAWTGAAVVNDSITAAEAADRAAAVGGRAPLLWDNYPVNDAIMADRLFLGPLRGRDPALAGVCGGYLANPMVQPRASKLPLASIAAWLRDEDPAAAWEAESDALGWRTLAEACDGALLGRLVADLAAGADPSELAAWIDAAADCEAPGLEDEARPWVEQLRAEAAVGRSALRLLAAAGDGGASPDKVLAHAFEVMFLWPPVRRSAVSVLGPRCAFRPSIGQGADGAWALRPDALQEDGSALDALVRLAWAATAPLA